MTDKEFELQSEQFIDSNFGLFNYDSIIPRLDGNLYAVNRTFLIKRSAITMPEWYRKENHVFCPLERGYLKINNLI